MLPRKNRLSLRQTLQLKNKRLLWQGNLVNVYAAQINSPQSLVAVVVSRKVSLSSVLRHQVKRKISEAILVFLPKVKNTGVIVYAKPEAVRTSLGQIKEELQNGLSFLK